MIQVEVDGEFFDAPEELVEACASVDTIRVLPSTVGVIRGELVGEPCRGLRVEAAGVVLVIVLPEEVARRIGRQLGDGGVIRGVAPPP
jgi:hypothetical protein